ncbi:hypothetical protein H1R20_g10313, partial [Candolleomyces eurysporus]
MNVLQGSENAQIQNLVAYQVEGGLHQNALTINAGQRTLFDILKPIVDASHTRDRKRSPPDSACFPGTRLQVVKNINTWARSDITTDTEPHVRWMHGYVGSGKSSISQEVCGTSEREDRPVISFFFFRNAGDRGKIWRLATTLAYQMASVIPRTEPFIREAAQANPALLAQDEGGISLRTRMQCLVYAPFKAVVRRKKRVRALTRGPFLMVLDGLDECDNKDEVQELIDGMLAFFNENPLIPLRVFITSRVEEHIHSRLNVPAVRLDNLVDHCSDDDIATFLRILFEDGCKRNSVVRAYVQQHGEWPTPKDRRKLVKHIGGSFIFASAVFKFIMATNTERGHPVTPMDRLPLALEMNPGLDGLYAQTLSRSKHLPHFSDIISTIALLEAPLPISGIADLLGIYTYEVVNVLVNLQAIIQVPGTDNIPVTLCHTSLRDFLTTQSRSGIFFARPSYQARLFLRCLECKLEHLRQNPALCIGSSERMPVAMDYALWHSIHHANRGKDYLKPSELNSAIQLCREALALQPGTLELVGTLAIVVTIHASQTKSRIGFDEAISLHRAILKSQPPHQSRLNTLENLGRTLMGRYRYTKIMEDLDEILSLFREVLESRPYPHPHRSALLSDLSGVLHDRYRRTGTVADLEEAISLLREALKLRPSRHPDRSDSLNSLGNALRDRHQRTGTTDDLEESISMHREAVGLQPLPHPDRPRKLNSLGNALVDRHWRAGAMADLEEAVSLYREALELRPTSHLNHSLLLSNLGSGLEARYQRTGTMADLEEAISLFRDALKLQPSPLVCPKPLENLVISLRAMYKGTQTLSHLQEAIVHCSELLASYYPVGHRDRARWLLDLASLLQIRFDATGQEEDRANLKTLKEEAIQLSASSKESAA